MLVQVRGPKGTTRIQELNESSGVETLYKKALASYEIEDKTISRYLSFDLDGKDLIPSTGKTLAEVGIHHGDLIYVAQVKKKLVIDSTLQRSSSEGQSSWFSNEPQFPAATQNSLTNKKAEIQDLGKDLIDAANMLYRSEQRRKALERQEIQDLGKDLIDAANMPHTSEQRRKALEQQEIQDLGKDLIDAANMLYRSEQRRKALERQRPSPGIPCVIRKVKFMERGTALLIDAVEWHSRCMPGMCNLSNCIETDVNRTTPLMQAARTGCAGCVEVLCLSRSDLNEKDDSGDTALIYAAVHGEKQCLEILCKMGVDCSIQNNIGRTALMQAARYGHSNCVNALLKFSTITLLNTSDKLNHQTALMLAAREGHFNCIESLVDEGASHHQQDVNGQTALILAAFYGHESCLKVLLSKGADIDVKDANGCTALIWAAYKGHHSCVHILCKNGSNYEMKHVNGRTALMEAACYGNESCLKVLLSKGAYVDVKDENGCTALILAACMGQCSCVNILCKNGSNYEMKNVNGRTALMEAARYGKLGAMEELIKFKANCNQVDEYGNTALMLARKSGSKSCIEFLCKLERKNTWDGSEAYARTTIPSAHGQEYHSHTSQPGIYLDQHIVNSDFETPSQTSEAAGHSNMATDAFGGLNTCTVPYKLHDIDQTSQFDDDTALQAVLLESLRQKAQAKREAQAAREPQAATEKAQAEREAQASIEKAQAESKAQAARVGQEALKSSVKAEWECSTCTFLNPSQVTICECCFSSKTESSIKAEWECSTCTFLNPSQVTICECCISSKTEIPAVSVHCRGSGCTENHSKQYCRKCKATDSDPFSCNCSSQSEKCDWLIDFKDLKYQDSDMIGQGGYGKVYKAKWKGSSVAVKMLLNQRPNEEIVRAFKNEISIFSKLRHPNIAEFFGACITPYYAIVMDFYATGTLKDALKNAIPPPRHAAEQFCTPLEAWPWSLIEKIAYETACGMGYLHACVPPILHRDLKSANILLGENYKVRITDFGISKTKVHGVENTSERGTCGWMAPEVMIGREYDERADVYSYAVVCWELLERTLPYQGMKPCQIMFQVTQKQLRPSIPDWCPLHFKNMITFSWGQDPKRRPNFTNILDPTQMPWSSDVLNS